MFKFRFSRFCCVVIGDSDFETDSKSNMANMLPRILDARESDDVVEL